MLERMLRLEGIDVDRQGPGGRPDADSTAGDDLDVRVARELIDNARAEGESPVGP
jgi:hypothetical protein